MQRHGCDSTHAEKKLFIARGQKHYLCKTSETNRAEAKNYPSLFSQLSRNVQPTAGEEEGEEEEVEQER